MLAGLVFAALAVLSGALGLARRPPPARAAPRTRPELKTQVTSAHRSARPGPPRASPALLDLRRASTCPANARLSRPRCQDSTARVVQSRGQRPAVSSKRSRSTPPEVLDRARGDRRGRRRRRSRGGRAPPAAGGAERGEVGGRAKRFRRSRRRRGWAPEPVGRPVVARAGATERRRRSSRLPAPRAARADRRAARAARRRRGRSSAISRMQPRRLRAARPRRPPAPSGRTARSQQPARRPLAPAPGPPRSRRRVASTRSPRRRATSADDLEVAQEAQERPRELRQIDAAVGGARPGRAGPRRRRGRAPPAASSTSKRRSATPSTSATRSRGDGWRRRRRRSPDRAATARRAPSRPPGARCSRTASALERDLLGWPGRVSRCVGKPRRRDQLEVVALAARQDRDRDLVHLGGREDEHHVRGRLLQRLEAAR